MALALGPIPPFGQEEKQVSSQRIEPERIADEGGKTIEAVAHFQGRFRFRTQNGRQ
jgi:hypothetical protein